MPSCIFRCVGVGRYKPHRADGDWSPNSCAGTSPHPQDRARSSNAVRWRWETATGQLAKIDGLDADTLALFAERLRPTTRPLADEAARPVSVPLDEVATPHPRRTTSRRHRELSEATGRRHVTAAGAGLR